MAKPAGYGLIRYTAETLSTTDRAPAEQLYSIISEGVALDVFNALMCAELLEEIDRYVDEINSKNVGSAYFGNSQIVLEHHMLLLIWRIYEPHSSRNPKRTLPAALHLIRTASDDLTFQDRTRALAFARTGPAGDEFSEYVDDLELRDRWLRAATHLLPRPQENANSDLSRALHKIQNVRHEAIAHRGDTPAASLLVPGWPQIRELIETAEKLMTAIADAFLRASYHLQADARRPVVSLRRMLDSAGLVAEESK